ncbi:hypothetical protein EJB05_05239, partial [Eragrostis curvula]
MCYQVKCGTCGKSTWAGCGRHVASVHAQVPEGQHCACRDWPGVVPAVEKEKKAGEDSATTAAAEASSGASTEASSVAK